MKNLISLGLAIFFIISGCSQQKPQFPQGAWKLVKTENIVNGKTSTEKVTSTDIKIWSERNWEFVWKDKIDTSVIYYYGEGSYTLDGKNYEEKIDMHVAKKYEGQKLNMLLYLQNDTLIQSWNPLDSLGKPDKNLTVNEEYIRQ